MALPTFCDFFFPPHKKSFGVNQLPIVRRKTTWPIHLGTEAMRQLPSKWMGFSRLGYMCLQKPLQMFFQERQLLIQHHTSQKISCSYWHCEDAFKLAELELCLLQPICLLSPFHPAFNGPHSYRSQPLWTDRHCASQATHLNLIPDIHLRIMGTALLMAGPASLNWRQWKRMENGLE